MLVLLLGCSLSSFAADGGKPVSLDEAIHIALENHPRLKMATAEISRARATRGEIWDGGSTSFSYSWGQLNGEFRNDHELSVEQSLGSLLTPFYKNALVNTQVEKGEAYRNMVKKEIVAEVKRAWAYYQYAYNLYQLYNEQESLAGTLRSSGELRYQQGDIDLSERNMITTMASDLHTRWLQAKDEVRLAARRFAWACYADSAIVPQDTSLSVLPFDERSARELSQDHLSYFSMQVKEKKDLLRIERSKFFPEFSVGYAQQKIFPLRKLDSWMVGISFPLLFFPQQSRSKQAKIDWQIASYEADQNRTQLQNKVADLQGRISQQRKSLDYYSEAALREADALQESSMLKFRESEIGISELVQSLNTVREIRKGYIENVYNYNVSLLEMELYTE